MGRKRRESLEKDSQKHLKKLETEDASIDIELFVIWFGL